MVWLAQHLTDVKGLLTSDSDDWSTWDYSPELIPAPAIAIMPGSPFLDDSDVPTYGTLQARFVVTLIPDVATNEKIMGDLIALIETSVVRLYAADYGVEQVGQPYVLEANNARYVAVDITITTDVHPEDEEGD